MRKINCAPSSTNFKVENKYILKLKEIVRNFRQKNSFYSDHSKFATYADPEYLSIFKEELIEFSKAWIRLQQKNMSSEKEPGVEDHANSRLLHILDTAINASISSKEQLLHEDLAFIGGLIHDIAHLPFAHDGEQTVSKYLEKNGICEIHHSSMARLSLELEGLHDKVIKRMEEKNGKTLGYRKLKELYSTYLTISDIAVCHNGESNLKEVKTNRSKTDSDVEKEYINTFVEPGLDRKTRNRSKEGAIVLLCDPISYVAKDFRDGIIKGAVDVNDPDYEKLFIQMGISKSELDNWALDPSEKKNKIVKRVTRFFRDNLTSNSKGIDGAKMSPDVGNLMYELRELNYEKSIKNTLRKINDILPERTGELIDLYSGLLVEDKSIENFSEFSSCKDAFLATMKSAPYQKSNAIFSKIVETGIERNVRKEVTDIIEGKNSKATVRRKRFEEDIKRLEKLGPITEATKEAYISRVLNEIHLTPKQSQNLYKRNISARHPNTSSKDLKNYEASETYLRLETYEECMAKFKTSLYIAQSTNDFLLKLLLSEGLLTEEEYKQRYLLGGDPKKASIHNVQQIQKNELLNEQNLSGATQDDYRR